MSPKAHLTTLASKTTDLSGTQKNDVTTMQGVNSIICSQTPYSNTTAYYLIDDRQNYGTNDKYKYRIKKFGYGRCWMVQNLALKGDTTINSTYSNISGTYKLPTSNSAIIDRWDYVTQTNANIENMFNATHVEGGQDTSSTASTGAMYTWQVATAGSGSKTTKQYEQASQDICPAGWRLPTYYTNTGGAGEYAYIENNSAAFVPIFDQALVGLCNGGGCVNLIGKYVFYHSSTRGSDATTNYQLHMSSGDTTKFSVYNGNRHCGRSIRCIVKN